LYGGAFPYHLRKEFGHERRVRARRGTYQGGQLCTVLLDSRTTRSYGAQPPF
jgi:hypothetical protein